MLLNASYTNATFILYFISHCLDFYFFLPPSRFFHSLPMEWDYITFALTAYLECSRHFFFHDVYLHCISDSRMFIVTILIDSKYSISPLKAFVNRVATIHKTCLADLLIGWFGFDQKKTDVIATKAKQLNPKNKQVSSTMILPLFSSIKI